MTTVTLTKAIGGHTKGATINVTPGVAAYLTNTGHVEETSAPIEETDAKPAGNASVEAWHDYALRNGHTEAELDGLKRDDIKTLIG
ncbi:MULTISPECIES: hypothetical protein [unclassified Arthrobacter]|uniref:hypothetical protein n=1 Tax=unclassified Arthrobacter TaxID=235627 RepID=UPI001490DE03|nr:MULTISPECIES: hypothetical protein [unclassified Arthrobacter]MBE0009588.1 hypothetical protein [Arthrobacter sp. AET 35A]NOJ63338.1 hypothetical protein [Arthrobacter sp. 147(2020)]